MKRVVLIVTAISTVLFSAFIFSSRVSAATAQPPTQVAAEFEQGQKLYQYHCASCHGAGTGREGRAQLPGTAALQEKYQGNLPALLEERTDLTPEFIRYVVRNGMSIMPFYRKTEISEEELEEISAYLTRPRNNPER